MKSLISEKLSKVLQENVIKSEDISIVKGYIEASNKYDILVNSGLATKRGNNLLSKDKVYTNSAKFNV
jgi:hypothetical protein